MLLLILTCSEGRSLKCFLSWSNKWKQLKSSLCWFYLGSFLSVVFETLHSDDLNLVWCVHTSFYDLGSFFCYYKRIWSYIGILYSPVLMCCLNVYTCLFGNEKVQKRSICCDSVYRNHIFPCFMCCKFVNTCLLGSWQYSDGGVVSKWTDGSSGDLLYRNSWMPWHHWSQ